MLWWGSDISIREVQVSEWIWGETLKEGKSTELLEQNFQQELIKPEEIVITKPMKEKNHQNIRSNSKGKSKQCIVGKAQVEDSSKSVWLFNFVTIFITYNPFTAFISSPGKDPPTQSCSEKQIRRCQPNNWE